MFQRIPAQYSLLFQYPYQSRLPFAWRSNERGGSSCLLFFKGADIPVRYPVPFAAIDQNPVAAAVEAIDPVYDPEPPFFRHLSRVWNP